MIFEQVLDSIKMQIQSNQNEFTSLTVTLCVR